MDFVDVGLDGEVWEVSTVYAPCVAIGEALRLARDAGCELPSPQLADAIWLAADAKLLPMPRAHDGTPRTMASEDVFLDQQARILGQLEAFPQAQLVAGCFKDVVLVGGKLALYGWHVADEDAIDWMHEHPGIKLHAAKTAHLGARVVQPVFGGHALSWRDYSQGARFVRRKA